MPRAEEVLKHGTERRHALPQRVTPRFGPKKFIFFAGRPQNFSFEIARERAEIRVCRRFAALPRPSEVHQHCAERRHAAPRDIACDFRPKFSKIFGGRKIFRSKSHEIAPKSMPPGDAQLAYDPQRSLTTVPSVGMLRRVRLHAIFDRNFRKISAALRWKKREFCERFYVQRFFVLKHVQT